MSQEKKVDDYGQIMIKDDCLMYNQITNACKGLNQLYCKNEKCNFYKSLRKKCNDVQL